jgi:lipoprotein NlpD
MARWPVPIALAAGLSLLAACTTTSLDEPGKAPVSDRSIGSAGKAATATAPLLPGQENAGKPGYYTVRPGDTLTRIGLETGQHPRDLARWNALENPNLIEIGQVLRVVPPLAQTGTAPQNGAVAAPVAAAAPEARVKPRPLSARNGEGSVRSEQESAALATEDLSFSWPGSGSVVERFDEVRNKGIDIAGKAGDPVLAAADGRVVYAGSGLRGYGNLIILKHNNTYLTAYAHNQALLVKEDQSVRQGQKIAEMGSSDADRVKLHFEVRRQGKPVDPLKFLPSR